MAAMPRVDFEERLGGAEHRPRRCFRGRPPGPEQIEGLVKQAVRMHIDGLDPLSRHHDGQFLTRRLLGVGALQQAAAAKGDAGGGSGACFQEISAGGHRNFLHMHQPGLPAPSDAVLVWNSAVATDGQIVPERMPLSGAAARQLPPARLERAG